MLVCHLAALSAIINIVASQEHLTCLRTDGILQSNSQPLPRAHGKQGKRGPKGEPGLRVKGEKGERGVGRQGRKGERGAGAGAGAKGEKGEPGVNLNFELESLLRGYVVLEDDWIAPFNGYKYKLTPKLQIWANSQQVCQNWGGDLAVHGVRDYQVKLTIARALFDVSRAWIGLNDINSRGNWFWITSQPVSVNDFDWTRTGANRTTVAPENNASENCAVMVFRSSYDYNFLRVRDYSCATEQQQGLCEKLL